MDIAVKCLRGDGDREAPEIQDELIVSERLAVLRGMAFLDQAYYHRTARRIRTPYSDVRDGQIVRISAPEIADGNYHVKSVEISMEGPSKAMMTLETEGDYVTP
jgi:hypothetical protein